MMEMCFIFSHSFLNKRRCSMQRTGRTIKEKHKLLDELLRLCGTGALGSWTAISHRFRRSPRPRIIKVN